MLWFYFDASALAKRYSNEVGTDVINEIFNRIPARLITCLTLGILEVVSILVRKKNDGRLSNAAFRQAMINFRVEIIDASELAKATIDDQLVMSAISFISKHNINATDAVILRSVVEMKKLLDIAGDQIVLSTSDRRLAKAARNEGITVFDTEVESRESLEKLLSP